MNIPVYTPYCRCANNEKLEMQPEKIHQKIDKLFCKLFCFSLKVNPNSLATSLILKATFAVDISPRFKHLNLMIFILAPHSLLRTTRVTRPTLAC